VIRQSVLLGIVTLAERISGTVGCMCSIARIGSRGGYLGLGVVFDGNYLVVVSAVDGSRVHAMPTGFESADQSFCLSPIAEGFCDVFGGVDAVDDDCSLSSAVSRSCVSCSVPDAGSSAGVA
jgi:hypothetical protein